MTDASDTAVGAVLQQQINGEWKPIAFFSKRLNQLKQGTALLIVSYWQSI